MNTSQGLVPAPPRIDLFIPSLLGGGAERICVIFANGLVQQEIDTRLVVLDLRNAAYAHLLDPRVRLVSFDFEALRAREYEARMFTAFTTYVRETRPTCCYAILEETTSVLIAVRDLHRFPITIIGEQQNNLTLDRQDRACRTNPARSAWKSKMYRRIVPSIRQLEFRRIVPSIIRQLEFRIYRRIVPSIFHRLYPRADHVVAVSEGVRQQLVREHGFREDQVSTIYNCVDPHIQQQAAASPRIPSPPAIYAIGRLMHQKGFDRLIAAFALCSQQRPDLQLHILGQGVLRDALQHQIDQLGLTHAITLHGFKRDIAQIYPQIPVLAMSSHFEGLPLVLTEAITFGVPVVAFDCDFGPAEIIVEGVNGYLVPQDDVPALAQALLRALETEWDTEQIKATARRFAPDTMVQAKLALIQRLCLSKRYRP